MNLISKNISCENGQAFAETAIVLPVYILFLLCFIQLIMIIHTKLILEYAGFCAARAGIVNQADPAYMQEAAIIAMSPLFSRTKSIEDFSEAFEEKRFDICSDPDCSFHPIRVFLLNNPSPVSKYNSLKSTFDLSQEEKVLHVKLEYDYPMNIPVANKIMAALLHGFINTTSTLDSDFFGIHFIEEDEPVIPLFSTCAMRLTTLSKV